MSKLETDGGTDADTDTDTNTTANANTNTNTDTGTPTTGTTTEGPNSSGNALGLESGRNNKAGRDAHNGGVLESIQIVGQEIRRSSANAVAVDLLYVFTIGFFASLSIRGFWPALIAAFPIAVLLGFAWLSSRLFFLTNVLAIVVAIAATRMGLLPL
ncbi:hypothetical protein C483_12403 [Natrialba hulunbeirensis JCM 10989]|uniref:Uncharacterized protein n=1 Tax=Natrialba hulunbeirensis JCM 10989 TaxID=1227493 RepID=L9ZW64_9EURY|nr:hypothetical protein [Natrialba hulunbeirensis]ELY90311.1 hypothetical protein C483_12403 [Natrialba hulunbeirensis JCM 10989]